MQTIPKTNAELTEFDWNFDNVSNNELVACCFWEYARESAFFLDLKKRLTGWDDCGRCPEKVVKGFNRIQQSPMPTFFHLDAMLGQKEFPCPWLKLHKRDRRKLIKLDFGLPAPFALADDLTEAESLLEAVKARIRQHRADVEKVHDEWPGYGEGTLSRWGKWPKWKPLGRIFWDDGFESIMVRIAWESYTNEQIIEAFRDWIKKHRPRQFPAPSGKGHKQISHRVALERLGIMRLLHRFRLTSLPKQNPAAWKRYNSPNRRWRKDAQKARAYFKSLFPFLKNEPPLSWPPKD
jgi:hypothetical protein